MKLKSLLFLPLVALLAGCSIFGGPKVPQTAITFDPSSKSLNIKSPKNVTIGEISVVNSNGNFSLNVKQYASTNDAAVVAIVTQAQADIAKSSAAIIQTLADTAAKAAAKAP